MPVTVSDLIHSSMRLIGAIAAGETLETEELNDAFVSLNQMIASWNTEGASLVARKQLTLPVPSGNHYLLPTRPIRIDAASVSISGRDCPLELVDAAGWESITEKGMLSVEIKKLYCDYGYPTSTIAIWPTPRTGDGILEMWVYAAITQFATVNDTIDLAPGYEIALRYNFAIALLPEYPRSQVDPTLPAQAQNYKTSIVQLNAGNHMRSQTQAPTQALIDQSSSAVAR
jgi:hypothetical protein